ncbi:transcription factor 20 [Electrophorus electricus]|uniref:transcription factor 20 n=1 Tax=Electrophorus electricus TaxID=8005 RepID=UPI0015CF9AEC|nr:transcription factor 20 [Electrophorus electricus]
MQNFPNSPAPPPGFPSRGGNMLGSHYPPHLSEPQISPRTTEDYPTLHQAQSLLQSHGQHLHMRAQHPAQVPHVHSYGSRRGAGEIPHSGSSSTSYRKESMDYYFSVGGRDRNRRGGGAYGAGFGYPNMDGHIPHQYRHVSGSGSTSGLMSPYPMDYSASASSGNSGAGSFSPSHQFNVAQNAPMTPASGADMHQHQPSQKYPSHQGLHQGHRTYSLSGHRIPSQFGHYPSLNAPTASAGMYNSPPQRYETSSSGSVDSKINNSPTQSNPNSAPGPATSNNSGHQENVTQNYPSSTHPPYSPQSHPVHKHAVRRTAGYDGFDGFEASLKMQHAPPGHAHPKNPQSSVSSSPATPHHSTQDISKSPMHSQNQQTHVNQNFSPISNPSPAPSVVHSPSCSSSSSPLMGVSEGLGNTAPPNCPSAQPPSQTSLLHPRSCLSHGRPPHTMPQLSPTPSSNSSISSCGSSAGSKPTGLNANALNPNRMGVGSRGAQREEGASSLYPQDKLSQDPGLNSLNALTSQVANLPNTVQHMQLTDTVLSQKKSRDGAHQPHSQQSAANHQKPRMASLAGHTSANEESGDILGSKPEEARKDHTDQSELEKVRQIGGTGTEAKPASYYPATHSQTHTGQIRPGLHVQVDGRVIEVSGKQSFNQVSKSFSKTSETQIPSSSSPPSVVPFSPSPDAPACPPASSAPLTSSSSPTHRTQSNCTAEPDLSHSDDRSGLRNKNSPGIKDERNAVESEETSSQEPDKGKNIQNIVRVKVEHSSPSKQNDNDKDDKKSYTQHISSKTISTPEQSNIGVIGVIVSARSEQNPEATKQTEATSPHCAASYHLSKLSYSDEKRSINMFRDSGSHNGDGDISVETYTAHYDVSPKIEFGQSMSSNHCHLGPYKYSSSEIPYNVCMGGKNKGRAGALGAVGPNRYQDYHHSQSNFGSVPRKDAGVLAVGGRSGIVVGSRGQESNSQLQQPYPSLLQEVLQGYHLDRRYGRPEQASTHHQPQNMSQPHYHTRLPFRMIESIRTHGLSQSVMGGASVHPQMALGKPHTQNQHQEADHEMGLGLLHPPWDSEAQKPKGDHGISLEKGATMSPSNAPHMQQCSDTSTGTPPKHINLADYSLPQRKAPSLTSPPSAIQQLLLQEADSLTGNAESISHTQNSSSSGRRSVICDVSPSRRNTPEQERSQCGTTGASVIQQSLLSSEPNEQKCNKEDLNNKREQEAGDASKVNPTDQGKHTTDGQSSLLAKEEPSKSLNAAMDLNSELNRHNSSKGNNDTPSNALYHSQHHLSANPLSSPPRCKLYSQADTGFVAYGLSDTVEESKLNTHPPSHNPFHTLTSQSHVPPPANKLQTYPHPLSLQHPHTMDDRFDWSANTNRPKDITIHYNSAQNSDHKCKIQSPSDVSPNQHHLPRQHSYPGSHYDMKVWESYDRERAGNQHLRSTVPHESVGSQPVPFSGSKPLEADISREITEESAKAFHPAAAAIAVGSGGPNSGNTVPGIHQGTRSTKPGGSAETNPLMMRRRVRSFISPIPAKRLHQDFSSHRGGPCYHSPLSHSESRHLNESDSANVDPCLKLSSPSTLYPTPSTNSPPQGKTKILPPRRGRGLKLEAIVQKITPNKKSSYNNSHVDADYPDLSHYSSDIPDPEIGATFSSTPHREGGCLPYLDEAHSLDDLLPYRAEDAYSCDSQVLKQSMTGSSNSTLRNLPTDFDFGLGTAVSSGPGTSEADKDDFTLLGPLPPPPPLPRPVQGSPPPSSSVLSDIQQFTNTYQQLETRRGEQSAANLLRQKLQETGIGFDDYAGGDFYGATPPHSQSPGHHLLSRAPQHQLTSSRMGESKPPENIVPKGYFPSGKKKGRPVGSVNKQKRVQVQVQTAMSSTPVAPHTPPPPPPAAGPVTATALPTTPTSSTTEEAVTASVLPEQKPCPSLDLAVMTQPAKVDVESEDNQPEVDMKPIKHKQRKGKEGNEGAGSRGRQWRRRRGLDSKEDLDPQTGSGGNAGLSGSLQDTRKKVFSPYIHVERKIVEIGAVCTIVNSEDEKSKGAGKVSGSGVDGPSSVVASQMVRKEKETERLQEKGTAEQSDSAMQSGKLLPTSGYVLPGPVISESGHTGHFLCCLCQKWANYKNLGDLYGPFYPAEYAAKFPKNQPQIRQILSHTGAANSGSNFSSVSSELTAPDTQLPHPPNIKSADSDCTVSQTTNLASPATTVGTASPAAGEDLPCLSAKMSSSTTAQNWDLMPDVAPLMLKPPDLEIEITQKQKPEDLQQRPQHRKLTSHPRFKRRHKSSEDLPRTIPINSKASLPFQPPPPSLDSLGPMAQLAQLPLVPLDPSELWVHESCIVWTSGVYLVNGRLYGLQEALDGAREMNCSHCEMAGSTLGCYSKGCTLRYHYLCAGEADCYLNEDNFSLRCPKHKLALTSRPAKPTVAYQEQSERG